jgi:hypothetical protein
MRRPGGEWRIRLVGWCFGPWFGKGRALSPPGCLSTPRTLLSTQPLGARSLPLTLRPPNLHPNPLPKHQRYDGQTWIKTPEVLTRDRLAFAYQIRPAVNRLKTALLGLGGALAASVVLLAALPPPSAQPSAYSAYRPPPAPGAAAEEARSYEERVREFEPWALEAGEGDGGAARPTLLDHMRST